MSYHWVNKRTKIEFVFFNDNQDTLENTGKTREREGSLFTNYPAKTKRATLCCLSPDVLTITSGSNQRPTGTDRVETLETESEEMFLICKSNWVAFFSRS